MTDTTTHFQLTPAQREIIEALRVESDKENSNADFAKKYLDFGPEVFSKVLAALDGRRNYFDEIQGHEKFMERLETNLENVRIRRAREEQLSKVEFLKLSKHEMVIKALKECQRKSNENRLVMFYAPTGGGKTYLCKRLEREMGAHRVQTRQAWRKSLSVFYSDVAVAIGLKMGGENRPVVLEDAIKTFCKLNPLFLTIDEADYFGPDSLGGVKRLLNETQITILICGLRQAIERWKRNCAIECIQLDRRTHAAFEQSAVSVQDAALFFPQGQFADTTHALENITFSASMFGHFSLIEIIADKLKAKKNASITEVNKAIRIGLRRMGKAAAEVGKAEQKETED